MKILFSLRSDSRSVFGGDVLYAKKIAGELKKLNYKVIFSYRHPPSLTGVDLVNVINVVNLEEIIRTVEAARRQSIPVVITPEYYNLDRFFLHTHWKANVARLVVGERLALELYRIKKKQSRSWRRLVYLLRLVDHVVAKSEREKRQLVHDFNLTKDKVSVVPNGVDPLFARGASPARFIKKYGVKDFLMTVGRVEPIKNQLSLLQATRGLGVPIVFIGGGYTTSDSYLAECKKEARGRPVHFIDRLPHAEIVHAYAAARAHVAPSFNETTSLASLEAVLAGCPLVITQESPYEEYLSRGVVTCDPYQVNSIKAAVEKILSSPPSTDREKKRLIKEFSWERIGRQLVEVYQALNRR